MRDFDPRYVGILAGGLRGSSRVFRAITEDKVPTDTKLLAMAVDSLAWLVWSKTTDAEHNRNRPKSVFDIVTGKAETVKSNNATFKTSEEFEEARANILKDK